MTKNYNINAYKCIKPGDRVCIILSSIFIASVVFWTLIGGFPPQ